MKIVVYAICKNEEKFINRWFNSMKEADEIYVLDTGSTDNTVSLLKKLGVNVKVKKINPWRFDVARNESLNMVPLDADLCVCTDLDEVFDNGWREKLEKYAKDATRVQYNYIWSFDKYGKPAVNFYYEKIHKRDGYIWVNPVHEVLKCNLDQEKLVIIDSITLKHYPDSTKSRSSYLNLLKLAVKEDPKNDRNMHYLGREYMFHGEYNKAIKTLKKHLKLKTATWDKERCASLRFISRCYRYQRDYTNALKYALLSVSECSNIRESYYETALVYYEVSNFKMCSLYLEAALTIINNDKIYINEPDCYNGSIEDLLSVCYYYLEKYDLAMEFVNKALEFNPQSDRLNKNRELIREKVLKTE